MQEHFQSGQPSDSASERKLQKLTHQLPFNPPSAEQIEQKINKMRMKIAFKNEPERKGSNGKEEEGGEVPRAKQKMYTENALHYNQITSLLSNRGSKASVVSRGNESKYPSKLEAIRRANLEGYREQLVERDKHKNPLKYKIVREEMGLSNDERVFSLRQDQVNRIQEQFMRRKGLEYLREGNSAANRAETLKFYSNSKGRTSSLRPRGSKIQQIFNNPISQGRRMKSEKSLKGGKGRRALEELREQEEMLGKIVFQKVKKHLKEEKADPNYFRRVYSEETIDDALVDFLRVKIERAEASLAK